MEVSKLSSSDRYQVIEGFRLLFDFLSNPAVVDDIRRRGYEIHYSSLTNGLLEFIGKPDVTAVGL